MESKTIDPDSETNASMNSIFAGQMSTEPVGSGTLHQPMLRSHQECSEMCNTQNVQYAMCKNKESKQNSSNSRTTSRSDTGKKTKNKKDQQKAVKNNSTDCERQNDGAIAASVGVSYQQAIAIVMVCHAAKQLEDDGTFEFTITSEDQQGSKFDDVVCCLPKVKTQILMQAKFKQDNTKKLRFEDIISTENNDFSISKYFKDFQHQKKKSENDKAKDQSRDKKYEVRLLALCTNIGLAEDVEKFVTKYACRDNIVDNFIRSLSDNVYKIDWKGINGNPNRTLLDHLRENSDLYSLAKQLADCICAGKGINFSQPLFEKYRAVVVKIGKGEKPEKEVDEIFFESDDAVSTDFKSIFEDEYCKQLIWQNIKEKGLELVKSAELQENQQNNYLKENTDIYSIAKQLAECIFECDYTNLPPTLYQSVFYEFGNTSKSIKIKKDFFESPDAFATDFKAIFEKEYFKLLIWDDVRKNKFMLDEHKMSEYNLPPIDEDSQIERFLQSFMVVCSARDEKTELTNNSVIAEIAAKVSVECYKVNKDFFKISKAIETYFRNIFENEYGKHLIWKDIRKKRFNYQRDHKRPSEEILPPKVTDIEIQEFVDSFIIVCNTKHDERVVIRNNLENSEYKLIPSDIQGPACEFAYDRLSKWIIKWIQSGKGAILTEQDTKRWFNLIRASLQYFQINELSGIQNHRFQCKNDELMSRKLYKKLESWLSGSNTDVNENFERCNYPPWLVVQVIQFLEEKSKIRLNILFLNADSYKKEEEKVKNVFCTMNFPLILVIDYKWESADLGEFSKWHSQDKSLKKMIITVEESYKPEDVEEKILIKHLTDESRSEITNKSTIFFGTPILYDEIFREEDGLNFVSDVESFPNHSAVKRNIIEEKYNEIQHVYIQRKLQQCGMEQDSFDNNIRTFWNDDKNAARMREELARDKNSEIFKTLHRLLRHSTSPLLIYLRDLYTLGKETQSNQHPASDALGSQNSHGDDYDMKKKLHIILNEAGSGKSYYLTWLARRLQLMEECKEYWIVKLNCINHDTDFKLLQDKFPNMDELDAIRLFYRLTHLGFLANNKCDPEKEREKASEISELLLLCDGNIWLDESKLQSLKSLNSEQLVLLRVFENKINNQKLIVMMDGFDEIAPDYKDVVLKLLKTLKNIAGVCKIYVTSRPYSFRQEMEKELGYCGFYRLEPFNAFELFTYMHRVISEFLSTAFEMDAVHVVLLEFLLSNNINTPLFVSLAVESLLSICEKYSGTTTNLLETLRISTKQLSAVGMMEKFINKKLSINVEKSGARADSVHAKKIVEDKNEIIRKSHCALALFAVFNESKVKELLSAKQQEKVIRYMDELKKGSERSGIVDRVVDNVPVFVHRIFAEYFAALWFHSNVKKEERKDVVKSFLKCHVYRRIETEQIETFLDQLICEKNDLHKAILDNCESKVENLLNENPNMIKETDCWGRTPLQLALFTNSKQMLDWNGIVGALLDRTHENDLNVKDAYFNWTVIDYAMSWLSDCYKVTKKLIEPALHFACHLLDRSVPNLKRNRRASFLKRLFAKLTLDLVSEKRLDLNLKIEIGMFPRLISKTLNGVRNVPLLEFCAINDSPMLQFLVEKSNEFQYIESKASRLLELALEHRSVNVLQVLHIRHEFPLPDKINFGDELLVLNAIMQDDQEKFKHAFHQYCKKHNIPCLEENQLQPVFNVQRCEKSISIQMDLLRYFPTKFELVNTPGMDVGTEFLIARALQTNNLSMLEYLILKTKITVNNRLIKRIVQIHKVDWYCQSSSHFLVHRSVDLRGVDEDGQNLLHFAVEQAQFDLVKCLIDLYEFEPTDINTQEHNWNALFYCVQKVSCVGGLEEREEVMRTRIFNYLMDLTKEPLNCFNQLDLDGKNVFYYAVKNNQTITDEIIRSQFSLPLQKLNEEKIIHFTKLLQSSGLDLVGILEYFGNKNLSHAAWCKICETLNADNVLLQYKDSEGRNILHIAVKREWFVLGKCLIERLKFNVEESNKQEHDWNAFFYCVEKDSARTERYLFFKYIMDMTTRFDCFNQLDAKGKSLFYYAVKTNKHISDDIIQRKFSTPLEDFNEEQLISLTNLLLQSSGFDAEALLTCFGERNHFLNEKRCNIICQTLYDNNVLKYKNRRNMNLLHIAILKGWFVFGKCLIERFKFRVEDANENEFNWNAFFYCVSPYTRSGQATKDFFCYMETKTTCLNYFSQKDSLGKNILFYAIHNGHTLIADSIMINEFKATGSASIEERSLLFLQRLRETNITKVDVIKFLKVWSKYSELKPKNEIVKIHAKMLNLIEAEY